jgi:hypothetical protein
MKRDRRPRPRRSKVLEHDANYENHIDAVIDTPGRRWRFRVSSLATEPESSRLASSPQGQVIAELKPFATCSDSRSA